MPFLPGEVVADKYEIVRLLGAGCIGFVVLARRVDLGDEVALKFLRPEFSANTDLVARFAREARITFRIESEHVARVLDLGNLADGTPFIVMERLEGRDLSSVLAEDGRLPIELAVEYVLQTCEAIATAHASGVVHRDIKPENLFLADPHGAGAIKVLDFGISKVALTGSAFDESVPLIRTIAAVGSPLYMSPEQIRACPDVDARSDIWALGCVLYELLAGVAAFGSPSIMQICAMILERSPVPLRQLNSSVPAELETVVSRCLEKEPHARFQNAGDLAVALAPFAPERARVWVERCCLARRPADFAPVGPRRSGGRSSVGTSGGLAISVLPPPDDTISAADVAAFRPRRIWQRTIVPAAMAGIVVAWFASRGTSTLIAPPEEHSASSAPAESAAVVVATPLPATGETSVPVATTEASVRPPQVASSSRVPSVPPVSPRRSSPSSEKPTRPPQARPAQSVEAEPDVGF